MKQPYYENIRGVPENNKVHPSLGCVLFSANLYAPNGFRRHYIAGHAMLTLLQPGEYWPHGAGEVVPVSLSHVHVGAKMRKYGHATALVKACLGYAARRRWPVVLRVTPYGRGASMLDVDQLTHWYARMGFRLLEKHDGITYMAIDYRR